MAKRSELTPQAKEDLLLYIAMNGENFEKYKAFAEKRGYFVFSPRYLHTWVGRHRPDIVALRTTTTESVKTASLMDRQSRIMRLERNAERLQDHIDTKLDDPDTDMDIILKMLEQHRKLLEAIAKERGEWLKTDSGRSDLDEAHMEIAKALRSGFAKTMASLPEPSIEGVFVEVPVAAP